MRVLLVSITDVGGGAEISAWNLFKAYRRQGHESWLAVGKKRTDDPHVLAIPNEARRGRWAKFWNRRADRLAVYENDVRGISRLQNISRWIGEPGRSLGNALGHEDFHYPGAWRLLNLEASPDIIHCYNLHGSYFDLRALPWLSHQRPVILDLRDAWLLSGHCGHSFGCDRWKTGCGRCPDLATYPAIRRDGTAYNWRRKQKIFATSRIYAAAPSRWLMQMVQESMLAPAIVESRVIPTGIDLSLFQPADKRDVRDKLNLPQDVRILLFAANNIRRNIYKDYATIRKALSRLTERLRSQQVLFIGLGEDAPAERIGDAVLRFIPHVKNASDVASYYQSADLYIHAATAETFPRAVLEALACGTPVVATRVGGIPEQIRNLDDPAASNGATGILVPPADPESMSVAIERVITDELLLRRLSENAIKDARERFDLKKQVKCYLDWYQQLVRK